MLADRLQSKYTGYETNIYYVTVLIYKKGQTSRT